MYSRVVLAGVLLAAAWSGCAAAWTPDGPAMTVLERGEPFAEVKSGAAVRTLVIHGVVDIKASRDSIFAVIVDCAYAGRLLPFVKRCRVLEEGPGWDLREHLLDYGVFAPRIRSRFRSDYEGEREIRFRCTEDGDLKQCQGEWRLEPAADGVLRVTYENSLTLPFKAPMGMVKRMLRRDVLLGLRGLRRAASAAGEPPH